MHSKSKAAHRAGSGFSLGELLACIAILGTMAAASGPAFVTLTRNNNLSRAVGELNSLMEGARQLAITQNTPVWMVFSEPDSTQNDSVLNVAIVASRTAEDPLEWTADVRDISAHPELEIVGRINQFPGVTLSETNSTAPAGATSLGDAQPLAEVQWDIQAGGKSRRFTHAMKFTSTGEARVRILCRAIEFTLAPLHAGSQNTASFRTVGVTGKISVIRPE